MIITKFVIIICYYPLLPPSAPATQCTFNVHYTTGTEGGRRGGRVGGVSGALGD